MITPSDDFDAVFAFKVGGLYAGRPGGWMAPGQVAVDDEGHLWTRRGAQVCTKCTERFPIRVKRHENGIYISHPPANKPPKKLSRSRLERTYIPIAGFLE